MVEDAPHTSSIYIAGTLLTIYFVWPRVVTGAAGPAPQPLDNVYARDPAHETALTGRCAGRRLHKPLEAL